MSADIPENPGADIEVFSEFPVPISKFIENVRDIELYRVANNDAKLIGSDVHAFRQRPLIPFPATLIKSFFLSPPLLCPSKDDNTCYDGIFLLYRYMIFTPLRGRPTLLLS